MSSEEGEEYKPQVTDELVTGGIDAHFLSVVFPPFLCMVCKRPGRRCTGCRAVSFCSVEHQKAAWPEHKRVCKFVKESSGAAVFNPEHSKLLLSNVLMNGLRRICLEKGTEMTEVERLQLAHIARCVGCNKFPVDSACKECHQVGFCAECLPKKSQYHRQDACSRFKVTQQAAHIVHREKTGSFSFGASPFEYAEALTPEECFQQCMDFVLSEKDPESQKCITSFSAYARASHYWDALANLYDADAAASSGADPDHDLIASPGETVWKSMDPGMVALIGDTISWPLTCFSGIMLAPAAGQELVKKAIQKSNGQLIVDVVGAELEALKMPAWEEFIHRFTPWGLKHLVVRFVGPTLPALDLPHLNNTHNLCQDCQEEGNTFDLCFAKELYQDFVGGKTEDGEPREAADIAIAFNAGIYESPESVASWTPAIQAMLSRKESLSIFTSYDVTETEKDIESTEKVIEETPELKAKKESGVLGVSQGHRNPLCSPLFQPDLAIDGAKPFTGSYYLFTVHH